MSHDMPNETCQCGTPLPHDVLRALMDSIVSITAQYGEPPKQALAHCRTCRRLWGFWRDEEGGFRLLQAPQAGALGHLSENSLN
jgi:hypothetical protein